MATPRSISVPLRLLIAVLALAFVVTACSGDDDEPEATPSSAPSSDATESETPDVEKPVSVGPWDVLVTEIEADGTATVIEANKFNQKPKGQYVLAVVEATYTGKKKKADAIFDLTWTFTDADGNVYENAFALGPNFDAPTTKAGPGETVTVDVTFDVPAGTAEGGTITVEALGKTKVITQEFPVD
ncbi:MAG: hypothetical protein WB767_10825 [Nocardioides sp.]